jgi:hypothetical protein
MAATEGERGRAASRIFRFMQKGVDIRLDRPVRTTEGGSVGYHPATLSVHVMTHCGDAAVSCRLRGADGSILGDADGRTTNIIVHSSKVAPREAGFEKVILLSVDALREQELALFAEEDSAILEMLSKAFDDAGRELLRSEGNGDAKA